MRIDGDGCQRLLALEISKKGNVRSCACVYVRVRVCVRARACVHAMLETYRLVNFQEGR